MATDKVDTIKLELKSGSHIWAEVTPLGPVGNKEQNVSSRKIDPQDFTLVTDTLTEIADALEDTLKKIKPHKATVEFGVELGLESGKLTALLVKGTAKANLKVSLTWENPSPNKG